MGTIGKKKAKTEVESMGTIGKKKAKT